MSLGQEPTIDSEVVAADLRAENAKLRVMLACQVSGAHLYADDGEMQDNSTQPFIDFKRDDADTIQAKMIVRAQKSFEDRSTKSDQLTIGDQAQLELDAYSLRNNWPFRMRLSQLIEAHSVLFAKFRKTDAERSKELEQLRENVAKQARESVVDGEYVAMSRLQHMTLSEIVSRCMDQGIDGDEIVADHTVIDYTNYKGERGFRNIQPERLRFGATEYHPEKQWLLEAYDLDKEATRTFAVRDIHSWRGNFRWLTQWLP